VLVAAALSAMALAQRALQSILSVRLEARLYSRAVDATLRADVLQRSVFPDGEALAVFFDGLHAAVSVVISVLPNLAANVVAAGVFAVAVPLSQPSRIALAAGFGCTLGAAWLLGLRGLIARARARLEPLSTRLVEGVVDAFDGRLDIVSAGRTEAYITAYAGTVRSWKSERFRSELVATLAGRLPLLTTALAVAAGVIVQSMAHGESLGHALVMAALLASMAPAFVGLAQGIQDLIRHAPRLQKMDAMLAVARICPREGKAFEEPVSRVELRDVRFSYSPRGIAAREALRGVSFAWNKGQLVALAGPNGSGKSTCLHAILATARPQVGEVVIDGVSLAELDVERWRRQVCFLPQRPYLPPRTSVRACLRFLEPDASDARMSEAMGRVGLPNVNLDASVDALSVGQRQRIGIARALCSDRPVVLLDEPDAGLDFAGLGLVAGLCRELACTRMVLVAAHSQELLAAADRVILLEQGRVTSDQHREPPIRR
jgi:ABC-type transport system involved in cytochrome bd biosynthesis fused ATPase/permease subunit